MTILFPIIYACALIFLIWKAFRVMSNGYGALDRNKKKIFTHPTTNKKYTIHPELLDKSGNITDEELLTVRFSNDSDSTLEKGQETPKD
tara:strand:- start:1646 stop:1912 length:267 start_codon:yes stop_codon:yes gene_type:complete